MAAITLRLSIRCASGLNRSDLQAIPIFLTLRPLVYLSKLSFTCFVLVSFWLCLVNNQQNNLLFTCLFWVVEQVGWNNKGLSLCWLIVDMGFTREPLREEMTPLNLSRLLLILLLIAGKVKRLQSYPCFFLRLPASMNVKKKRDLSFFQSSICLFHS